MVSVLILNWNKPELTTRCVEGIKAQTYPDIEIIVLENGSQDNSAEVLSKIEGIRLVLSKTNRGFAGGVNYAACFASGEYLFLLNNDAVPEQNYIEIALKTFELDEATAVVGGKQYASREKLLSDEDALTFQRINPDTYEGVFLTRDPSPYPHEVNWVSAAALLIRKDAFDAVGGFYEPFFAYYEESDLFSRLQWLGSKIVYNPSLRIVHEDAASTTSEFHTYQLTKNRLLYALRNMPRSETPHFAAQYKKTLQRSFRSVDSAERKSLAKSLDEIMAIQQLALSSREDMPSDFVVDSGLKRSLLLEQTAAFSFILRLSGAAEVAELAASIKRVSFHRYNTEFIALLEPSQIRKARDLVIENSLYDLLRVVTIVDGFDGEHIVNALARGDFLWVLNDLVMPSLDKIDEALLLLAAGEQPAFLTPVNNTSVLGASKSTGYKFCHALSTPALSTGEKCLLCLRAAKALIAKRTDGIRWLVDKAEAAATEYDLLHENAWQANEVASIPVFIINRDRVQVLERQVAWFDAHGFREVYIVDNGSTYPPLLDYYSRSMAQVLPMKSSDNHTVIWESNIAPQLTNNGFYLVTDPDIMPDEACPTDIPRRLIELLIKYPSRMKVGLGLSIDDLPDCYEMKQRVLEWESQFWKTELEPNVYDAPVDTTFALYKPGHFEYELGPALRTGYPYVCRHIPWYEDSTQLSDEAKYYRAHTHRSVSTWSAGVLSWKNLPSSQARLSSSTKEVNELP